LLKMQYTGNPDDFKRDIKPGSEGSTVGTSKPRGDPPIPEPIGEEVFSIVTSHDSGFVLVLDKLLRALESGDLQLVGITCCASEKPFKRTDEKRHNKFQKFSDAFRSAQSWLKACVLRCCGTSERYVIGMSQAILNNLPELHVVFGTPTDLGLAAEEQETFTQELDQLTSNAEFRQSLATIEEVKMTLVRQAIVRKGRHVQFIQATLVVIKSRSEDGKRGWQTYDMLTSVSCRHFQGLLDFEESDDIETLVEKLGRLLDAQSSHTSESEPSGVTPQSFGLVSPTKSMSGGSSERES